MITGKTLHSVLIISEQQKGADVISGLLDRGTYSPVRTALSGSEARRLLLSCRYDVVIINTPLPDEFGNELALHAAENTGSGVALIVRNELFDEMCSKVENFGILTIAKPISKQLFHQAFKLLASFRNKWEKYEAEKRKLQAKNEELRIVSHAKCVLVEYLKMSEARAHRYIEKQAMDMRTTKRAIAEGILKTYEN